MNEDECKRRDGVLRAYIVGRDWDRNDEFMLKRELVLRSAELCSGPGNSDQTSR